MATVYIHYVFFPSFQVHSRKTPFCCLMLKATDFSWLWIYWVFFACWFLVFFSCYYFYFFSYFCTVATIIITITITSNNLSEGKGTLETSYKLWSSEFWSFRRRKEQATPKLILLLALGFGSTYTHTHTHTHTHTEKVWLQYKICTKWCNPTYTCFPCTWFWGLHLGCAFLFVFELAVM